MLTDVVTYMINVVLVYVVRRKKQKIMTSNIFHKSMELRLAAREKAITISVLRTVGAHMLMTTAPGVGLIGLSVALDHSLVTEWTFYLGLALASWLTFMESIVNVFIYVYKLPHFKSIVIQAVTPRTLT